MSTPKWSDDELDAFFRKSAEEADPPYDPAAWQDLKARLNKRDHTRWLTWLLPTLLLLLLTGSIVWYNLRPVAPSPLPSTGTTPAGTVHAKAGNVPKSAGATANKSIIIARNNRPAAVSKTESVASRPVPASLPAVVEKSVGNAVKPVGEHFELPVTNPPTARLVNAPLRTADEANRLRRTNVRLGNVPRTGTVSSRVDPAAKPRANQLGTRVPGALTPFKHTAQATPAGQRPLLTDRPVGTPNGTARHNAKAGGLGRYRSRVSGFVNKTPPIENSVPAGSAGAEMATTAVDQPTANPDGQMPHEATRFVIQVSDAGPIKPVQWSALLALLSEPVAEPIRSSMPRSARHRFYGLSVQAVLSPDLSTIGLHNFDRPGSNLGLLVQYQLSERFSVQTGALWSTKRYTSLASEYVWPTSGGMTVWPESITGRCTMFDIPLNLRYDLLLRPGGSGRGPVRWFVSGGVTSYFIRREMYDYNYAYPNDPAIKYRNWDINKGSTFGLSNLNISAGYERPVSKRLSWQVEPFLKVPLQPIGYFKVKLVSTGVFFSLRYHL